jgi:hypothetical protein
MKRGDGGQFHKSREKFLAQWLSAESSASDAPASR